MVENSWLQSKVKKMTLYMEKFNRRHNKRSFDMTHHDEEAFIDLYEENQKLKMGIT